MRYSREVHRITAEASKDPESVFDVACGFVQISRVLLAEFKQIRIFLINSIPAHLVLSQVSHVQTADDVVVGVSRA